MAKKLNPTGLDKQYHMRVTQSQLDNLFSINQYVGTASEFYRGYNLYTAEQLHKLQAGVITPYEFGSNISNWVQAYLTVAGATEPEKPEPEP